MRDHTAAIAGEQFRARLWRNNATRLSTMLTAEDDPKSGDCLCGDPIPCGPARRLADRWRWSCVHSASQRDRDVVFDLATSGKLP